VIRFHNEEVLADLAAVLQRIQLAVQQANALRPE
jgi:very-short-patch-repair endonuclease